MDFAKILDEWENSSGKKTGAKKGSPDHTRLMKKWIDSDSFWDSYDKGEDYREIDRAELRTSLRKMEPEAEIDLHGFTVEEALNALDHFIREASLRGIRKVLIIHGKGNHSKDSPMLPGAVLRYLQSSSLCGETGTAERRRGGSGATWVIVRPMNKRKNQRSR